MSNEEKILQMLSTMQANMTEMQADIKEVKEFQKLSLYESVEFTCEKVKTLDAKFDVLNDRLFQQEANLRQLKVAK